LLREDIQLLVVEAPAQQFELHLQAAGIADALNRGRRHDKQPAIRRCVQRSLQMLGNREDIGAFCPTALIPWLEHDKADAGAGEVGEIVER